MNFLRVERRRIFALLLIGAIFCSVDTRGPLGQVLQADQDVRSDACKVDKTNRPGATRLVIRTVVERTAVERTRLSKEDIASRLESALACGLSEPVQVALDDDIAFALVKVFGPGNVA